MTRGCGARLDRRERAARARAREAPRGNRERAAPRSGAVRAARGRRARGDARARRGRTRPGEARGRRGRCVLDGYGALPGSLARIGPRPARRRSELRHRQARRRTALPVGPLDRVLAILCRCPGSGCRWSSTPEEDGPELVCAFRRGTLPLGRWCGARGAGPAPATARRCAASPANASRPSPSSACRACRRCRTCRPPAGRARREPWLRGRRVLAAILVGREPYRNCGDLRLLRDQRSRAEAILAMRARTTGWRGSSCSPGRLLPGPNLGSNLAGRSAVRRSC